MAMRATSLHFVSALVAASVACSGNNGGSAGSNFTAGSGSIGGDSPVAGGQGGKSSSTPPSQCNPGADATWIEEGQSATIQLRCATGRSTQGIAFSIENLPDGARFDAETATVSWTPTLSQAGLYTLSVAVPQGETGKLKIGVADAFDDPSNVPVVDPSAYQEEYGLPVLHLTVPSTIEENAIDPTTGNKAWVPATIVYRGHTFAAEAKYRGNTSLRYPKRNYSLRFPESDQFSEEILEGAVKSRRHLELITTFDDPSQVRYRLALELWNRMDPNNVRVRQFSLVLFVNGQYWGVYAASDKVSASHFAHFGYSDLGNLYMGIDHQANFAKFRYNEPQPQIETDLKTDLAQGYEKKDGTPLAGQADAFADLSELVGFVVNSDEAEFQSELPNVLDVQNYYNWFIHTTAIQAFDSLGKNTLHYHDPIANTPWRMVPWDFNECFGQRWQTARFETSLNPADIVYQSSGGFGYTNRNHLWRRIWNNPALSAELKARYSSMLRGALSKENVLEAFDVMVAETATAAKRDDRKWQTQYRSYFQSNRNNDFHDSAGEAAYARAFIDRRWTDLSKTFP
ncbi:MAG TPA: CotH kinase family protein [Polyangiaceae bacterium]|nr:CotH kinase family protein [Polyangiaceae bacterium]